MLFLNFKNSSPATKLSISIVLMLFGFILFFALAFIFGMPLFSMNMHELMSSFSGKQDNSSIMVMKYFQVMQSTGLFIFPALVYCWLIRTPINETYGINKPMNIRIIIASIVALISFIPFINMLAAWNESLHFPPALQGIEFWMKNMETNAQFITKLFLKSETLFMLILNIFVIAVLPAVGEELLFRGVLQPIFSDFFKNKWIGILMTAFIFSAFHLQFYGFFPRLVLGFFLGFVYVMSGNIIVPMIIHFINNGTAVFIYHFMSAYQIEAFEKAGSSQNQLWMSIIGLFLGVGLIILVYIRRKKL